jgi:hypothetical protein
MAFLMAATDQVMSQTPELYPNPTPQDETALAADPSFAEACMARIADDAKQFGWRFGNSILTRSKDWGLVWRIDFETEGSRYGGNLVNRVICWRSPDSDDIGLAVAFGKRIDKLA